MPVATLIYLIEWMFDGRPTRPTGAASTPCRAKRDHDYARIQPVDSTPPPPAPQTDPDLTQLDWEPFPSIGLEYEADWGVRGYMLPLPPLLLLVGVGLYAAGNGNCHEQ